jgi:hypothetical protein
MAYAKALEGAGRLPDARPRPCTPLRWATCCRWRRAHGVRGHDRVEATPTKLGNRGTTQAIGLVTDVGYFLERLDAPPDGVVEQPDINAIPTRASESNVRMRFTTSARSLGIGARFRRQGFRQTLDVLRAPRRRRARELAHAAQQLGHVQQHDRGACERERSSSSCPSVSRPRCDTREQSQVGSSARSRSNGLSTSIKTSQLGPRITK